MKVNPTSIKQDIEKIRVFMVEAGEPVTKQRIKEGVNGNNSRIIKAIDQMLNDKTIVTVQTEGSKLQRLMLVSASALVHEIEDKDLRRMLRDAYDSGRYALQSELNTVDEIIAETRPKFIKSKVR